MHQNLAVPYLTLWRSGPVRCALCLALAVVGALGVAVCHPEATGAAPGATGAVRGRVHLSGKLPGNPVVRMGMDPMCAQINRGKQVVQETVVVTADGDLGNVFIDLQGKFPPSPVPAEPVIIDQVACFYRPRMVGARVGQTLQIRNSDPTLHNVHSLSALGNGFNVGQPKGGMVYSFRLKDEERMLRLKCDVHSWMTAYVGIVSHPYFAVSGTNGAFQIEKIPPGTYTVEAWHERYGRLTRTISVTAGSVANLDFTYTGTEPPPTARIRDWTLPAGTLSARLVPFDNAR